MSQLMLDDSLQEKRALTESLKSCTSLVSWLQTQENFTTIKRIKLDISLWMIFSRKVLQNVPLACQKINLYQVSSCHTIPKGSVFAVIPSAACALLYLPPEKTHSLMPAGFCAEPVRGTKHTPLTSKGNKVSSSHLSFPDSQVQESREALQVFSGSQQGQGCWAVTPYWYHTQWESKKWIKL